MHRKLTKHGEHYMQNIQLLTKILGELKDNYVGYSSSSMCF
jgi:hypothetical protein